MSYFIELKGFCIMTVYELIGHNLKESRTTHGYTQERLANELNTSASHLRSLEKGRGNPTVKTLECLADTLGVPLLQFFNEENRSDE